MSQILSAVLLLVLLLLLLALAKTFWVVLDLKHLWPHLLVSHPNDFLSSGLLTEFFILCTEMRTSDKFPWELLKAECLRLVCAQLVAAFNEGQNPFKPGRKEDMVAFLRDVHERGVMKALEDVEPSKKIIVSAPPVASPSKRKNPTVDIDDEEDAEGDSDYEESREGYNTRYKGVKRVKVNGFTPEPAGVETKRKVGRPRKSAPEGGVVEGRKRGRPRKDVSTILGEQQIKVSKGNAKSLEKGGAAATGEVIPSISRPRGRPRKVVAESNGVLEEGSPSKELRQSTTTNGNAPKSKDSGREVFDGIVLVKRNKSGKEKAVGDDDRDGEALNDDGDGSEEDAVLAAVNGDDAQGDLSSLGGSNKENEHVSATYTPEAEEVHDIDADGEFEADAEV